MKVTIELDELIVRAIADTQAAEVAYDWFDCGDGTPDATALYSRAFEDGMNYLLNLINHQKG